MCSDVVHSVTQQPQYAISDLVIYLDSDASMTTHSTGQYIAASVFYGRSAAFADLSLDMFSCRCMIIALVLSSSKLDYGNATLAGDLTVH